MARHFLAYWEPSRLDIEGADSPLNHAAGRQFGQLAVGDTVWFISIRAGRLELYGRIVIGQITDQAGAAAALGTRRLRSAPHHILASPGTVQNLVIIEIHDLAAKLRFEAAPDGVDRIKIEEDGVVTGLQLLTMRQLSPESVGMLSDAVTRES